MELYTSYWNIRVQNTGRRLHQNFQYLLPSSHYIESPAEYSDDEIILQMTKQTYKQFSAYVDNQLLLEERINQDPVAKEMMDKILVYLELKD